MRRGSIISSSKKYHNINGTDLIDEQEQTPANILSNNISLSTPISKRPIKPIRSQIFLRGDQSGRASPSHSNYALKIDKYFNYV